MSNYTQLTREQRYQIYALMKAGLYQTQIAKIVGVHKSTISREVQLIADPDSFFHFYEAIFCS